MKKRIYSIFIALIFVSATLFAQQAKLTSLPSSIYSGPQGNMHVQGIAVDEANGFVYFSFTDRLLKTDLSGKLLASVIGFVGHLGDLVFDSKTGKIYGSLEYKSDVIGKSISSKLGRKEIDKAGFYVVIFDTKGINQLEISAETAPFVKAVYIKEAVDDFNAKVKIGDRQFEHRFACSGIDGITLAPAFESPNDGKMYLYLAYGIYGDTTRNDNDYQVILKYDIDNWEELALNLSQDKFHQSGPKKPTEKYFVKTGNTNWGIQNLAYDNYSSNFYAAVYKGKKSVYPNYDLFVIPSKQKPGKIAIQVDNKRLSVKTLSLAEAGLNDKNSGIRGWRFKWGSTGISPLGEGLFYISHNKKNKDGLQETTLYKYKWVGDDKTAFVRTD